MFIQKLTYGQLYCAVEHVFAENEESFTVSLFSFKKKVIEIVKSEVFSSFDEVVQNIPKNQHVLVAVNNAKILSKTIDGIHEMKEALFLAFPNIKTSDFYVEVLPQENNSHLSISRKIDIDTILNDYLKNKIYVIGLSLGNNAISSILPHVNDSKLYTSNTEILILNHSIRQLIKSKNQATDSITINGLPIQPSESVNFSSVLGFITNSKLTNTNFDETISVLKDNHKQRRFFSYGFKLALGIILIGLLLNFVAYTYYNGRIEVLLQEQSVNNKYTDGLLKLTTEVDRKKMIVDEITSNSRSRVSFYMDEIGHSTPVSISLGQLYFQPVLKKMKPLQEIEALSNTILVSGESQKSAVFSQWISSLEAMEWVSKIEVLDYGLGSSSKTAFELKITLEK